MAGLQVQYGRAIAFCLAFTSHWHTCFASPLQLNHARWSSNLKDLQLLKRGISSDPSCPSGWLCEQQNCPTGTQCPQGTVCVKFEGTAACAPSGLAWCALNPSSFQGVACQNGICCHGNCYTADAVCCDNNTVECQIGNLCNVCKPGETCTTGQSTCAGGGISPTTTTAPRPPTTNPPVTEKPTITDRPTITEKPPVTEIPSVTKAPTVTEKPPVTEEPPITEEPPVTENPPITEPPIPQPPVTTTTTSTTPSSTPSRPTVVAQIGDFKNKGCFEDSPTKRILVADSTEDLSSNGMTVEKCVAFARKENWQYAGVEFGGQCFVGNTIHEASEASSNDCSQACAGDATQICGNGNRLQLYQDEEWFSPTTQQLLDALTEFNALLSAAKSAIQKYHDDMEDYEKAVASLSSAKAKRQSGLVLTPAVRLILEIVQDDTWALKAIGASIVEQKDALKGLFEKGKGLDLPVPVQGIPVTDEIFEELTTDVVLATGNAIDEVTQTAATAEALIGPALQQGIVPAITAVADIAVAAKTLTAVGLWSGFQIGVGVQTGIFGAIGAIFAALAIAAPGIPGGGNQPPKTTRKPETTTSTTTTSTKTSSSSSVCTMTATPTPIIIVTRQDTSISQFENFVESLPANSKPKTFTTKIEGHFGLIATLDQCTSEALWDNPNVEAMCIDNYVLGDETLEPLTVLPKQAVQRTNEKREESAQRPNRTNTSFDFTRQRNSTKRLLDDTSHVLEQSNAPEHLKWISGFSRQTSIKGPHHDFENFMFDDGDGLSVINQPWIYYIDPAGFAIHSISLPCKGFDSPPDYADRIGFRTTAFIGYDGTGPQGLTPTNAHGTNMASCAAGHYSGPAKQAILGLITLQHQRRYASISSTMLAFDTIIAHSAASNTRGRSVVAMSFGAGLTVMWWPAPTVGTNRSGLADGLDVLGVKLRDIFKVGIAASASAGNYGRHPDINIQDLSFMTPRRNGGTNSPLIVVGNNGLTNVRYPTSQHIDSRAAGILSIYAVGDTCVCGNYDSDSANTAAAQNSFEHLIDGKIGTSQANAQTAGVIANMLIDPAKRRELIAGGLPNFAMALKKSLLDMATDNKGTFPDLIPRLSNNITIPCTANVIAGPPNTPAANTPPFMQFGLAPAYQEVATGKVVTFPNSPLCYDRTAT